ncbi:MAG: DUF3343 domain-containing protein [Clostridia bacterium]|nr:DUF3343 domain-containing protein [Clostridia bacterium]
MQQYIIMCRSLTYAQRAAAALEKAGITAATSRAPLELTDGGCGYCVKVSERRFHDALKTLQCSGLPYGRVYRRDVAEAYAEVQG